jgi:hypothetical protein
VVLASQAQSLVPGGRINQVDPPPLAGEVAAERPKGARMKHSPP